ncbi:hypothetical protein [Paenibacillus sp. UNC496MF]|uniref:hypothetical protein n=1 Tax=Paenibacillus sp. UNC496MF TaxID=1502753 RepID=UPI000B8A485F|nr:hypothetical protein [Paenibacillus sp. UNC496MF]
MILLRSLPAFDRQNQKQPTSRLFDVGADEAFEFKEFRQKNLRLMPIAEPQRSRGAVDVSLRIKLKPVI